MTAPDHAFEQLITSILSGPKSGRRSGRRRLVALAGPPASGKSTYAKNLADRLCREGCKAQVVPMDGFHLHNDILIERGELNRKGAPETFDLLGFSTLIAQLHDAPEVFAPLFDRARDIAIAAAISVDPSCDTVIIEGNYLLLDQLVWKDLSSHWDLSVRLNVAEKTINQRLMARWLSYGMSVDQAQKRVDENDLKNAKLVTEFALPADVNIWQHGDQK